jgi:anti-sigma factor RsiW
MSHVDDGTLHAYLDGELTPVERERTDAHLAGCEACRARLQEERTLIERAGRLLGLAVPPEHAAPPLHTLRRPTGRRRFMIPLAWAATIALASGTGWYLRGFQRPAATPTETFVDTTVPVALAQSRAIDSEGYSQGRAQSRRDEAKLPASPASGLALRERTAPAAGSERAQTEPPTVATGKVASQLAAEPSPPTLRGAAAAAPAAADNAIVLTRPDRLKDLAIHRMSTTWPIIEPTRARDLLGEEPATIPGYPVHTLRSNPAVLSEIVVEQVVDSGVVLLFERRSDPVVRDARQRALAGSAATDSNERLARYVRSLRIEIAGALTADSLSKLLGLIR